VRFGFFKFLRGKSKEGSRSHQGGRVNAEGVAEIRRNFTQHLVRLDDLHRRAGRIEAERLPEFIDDADVDAGLKAATEIDG
jgi:hypothetical protein